MFTVHLIFNAHIDPIWLWPWQSGLDTLLATCRSACDRLDAHPDVKFVKGEAYAYQEVERVDPALFERIRKHIDAGRWQIVGGWWLQPDCNGPGGVGFQKQIALGKEYFMDKFGVFPRVGFNVDSFGHAATLPGMMRAAGQDRYCFMRPQEHEMELPARIFRWRGYEDGPEVTAFRIPKAYTTRDITVEHIQAALTDLPEGIEHTMSFVGFGDHGGGPTEQQIRWCRENAEAIDGCKLIFSTPDMFFDAIADQHDKIPLVTGELQHHSIGCYTVHRPVKVGVHHAEHRLEQARTVIENDPTPEPQTEERMREAWQWVCFGHFHDTYGGTCIPSAYEQVHAQLGLSYAVADEIIQHGVRRIMNKQVPDDPMQRIVLYNASDHAYDGYAIHEPWLESTHWKPHWRLVDEQGNIVPHQRMDPECLVPDDFLFFLRLIFPLKAEPGQMRALRIVTDMKNPDPIPSDIEAAGEKIANREGITVALGGDGELKLGNGAALPLPRLELLEDPTDTWTHEVDRYSDTVFAHAHWKETKILDAGPLMGSIVRKGQIGDSELQVEYRVYAGLPFVEWHVRVYWCERHKLLKMTWPMAAKLGNRWDGIPGGQLLRTTDGKERPVRDRTLLELADGTKLGMVFPDAHALDATPQSVRVTMLRSPRMAHHFPYQGPGPRAIYADQGMHEFTFRFYAGENVTGDQLDADALMLQRPLATADLTRGMPPVELDAFEATNMAT